MSAIPFWRWGDTSTKQGDATLQTLEAADAATVDDGPGSVKAFAVPGARNVVGEAIPARAGRLACDVEGAPGAPLTRELPLRGVHGAAVETASFGRDLEGNLGSIRGLIRCLLLDAAVEGDLAAPNLGHRGRRGRDRQDRRQD